MDKQRNQVRRLAKAITPPILVSASKLVREFIRNMILVGNVPNYENSELVELVIQKTINMSEKIEKQNQISIDSFRIAFALQLMKQMPRVVFDVGGGAGYQYFNAKKISGSKFDWSVIETPAMVKEASIKSELSEIKYFSSLDEAFNNINSQVDLIFCSRALQYFPRPKTVLKEILAIKPKYIFLTGITFSDDTSYHSDMQESYLSSNGPGETPSGYKDQKIKYPYQLIPADQIKEIYSKEYEIILESQEEPVVHYFKGRAVPYSGLWFKRRDCI